MKLAVLSLLGLGLATDAVLASKGSDQCPSTNARTIRTSTGSYTGIIEPEYPKVRQWRSIAFAKPPVGPRRWLPPQKLSPSNEHHYSTRYPPSCPQFVSGVENFWNSELTKGNLIFNGGQNDTSGLSGENTSEDCLYLAVWAPASTAPRPKAGLPVLFFMVGGGFGIGGVNLPWHDPTAWIDREQDFIVVSVNYRVNIFGFPNAAGLEDQNLGILDQRAALEWVRDNIAAFGGDPSRIMQWGRSAGSMSADIHNFAYHRDPIAQSYYMESGTVFFPGYTSDHTHSNFTFVARHFGCADLCASGDPAERAAAELDCMRQVPFTEIENFIGQYTDRGESPPLSFSLYIDERVFFSQASYHARAAAGKFARRPVLISATANEMSSLMRWPAPEDLETGPDPAATLAGNVNMWVCPTYNATAYRNRFETPVFRFQYAGIFPSMNQYGWLGAYHNSETPMVFGTYGLLSHVAPITERQVMVSRSIQDHIHAFAQGPWHGPQREMGWAPTVSSEPNMGKVLRFGAGDKVVEQVEGVEVDGVCEGLREYNPFP